ncbi:hypothetical protein V6N13_094793 [Hibiscus sabdariffa]
MLPNSLRGGPSKILMKKLVGNPSAKKVGSKQNKRDGQNSSPPTLEAGLSTLMKDLHNAVNLEESNLRTSPSVGAGDGDNVSWTQNSAFVQVPAKYLQD